MLMKEDGCLIVILDPKLGFLYGTKEAGPKADSRDHCCLHIVAELTEADK